MLVGYVGCLVITAVMGNGHAQSAQNSVLNPGSIGSPIEVTAGQTFYEKSDGITISAYRLERPFKSSMPGSMGFPFSFAIDNDELILASRTTSGWDYFVPRDHKFRAWHSLLGSIIRGRDTVGLRIGPERQVEWFVDNSVYYGKSVLWTRKVKPGDPALTLTSVQIDDPMRSTAEKLIYLGLTAGNRAIIRFEKTTARSVTSDEFTFPVDHNGAGVGAVNGAEFIIEASPAHAKITVTKSMNSTVEVIALPQ